MTLDDLAAGISDNGLGGVTIFRRGGEWMVSTKRETGFRPFFGTDLAETTQRAIDGGPQHPEDDIGDLI